MDLTSGSSSRHLRTHLFLSGRDSGSCAGGSSATVSSSSSASSCLNNDASGVTRDKMSRSGNGRILGRSQIGIMDKDSDFLRRRNNNNNNNKNNNIHNHHNNNVCNGTNPSIQISYPLSMNSPLINYKKYDINHIGIVDDDDEDEDDDLDDILLGISDENETPYDLAPSGSRANRGRSTRAKQMTAYGVGRGASAAASTSGSSIFYHHHHPFSASRDAVPVAESSSAIPLSSSSSSSPASSSSSAAAATSLPSKHPSSLVMTQLDFVGSHSTSSSAHHNHHDVARHEGTNGHAQEDCFIIPAHRMSVFLPIPFLESERRQLGSLNATHVDAPKISIVFHFAEPIGCCDLPTSQLASLKRLLARVRDLGSASDGMILINLEKNAMYPFIVYSVVNSSSVSISAFLHHYNVILDEELQLDKLSNSNQTDTGQGLNYIGSYEEVATIARPPIDIGPKTPSNPKTGYLITVFKVFPGEDREKLERSWLLWSGARMIYKHLPECLAMKRMTFHKKLRPDGGITYVLVCECLNMMEYVTVACDFVEHLRARCCGYTALYKSVEKF